MRTAASWRENCRWNRARGSQFSLQLAAVRMPDFYLRAVERIAGGIGLEGRFQQPRRQMAGHWWRRPPFVGRRFLAARSAHWQAWDIWGICLRPGWQAPGDGDR